MQLRTFLALGFVLLSAFSFANDLPVLEVGKAAPEIKLPAADGTSRSLEATNGATVLIFYRGLW